MFAILLLIILQSVSSGLCLNCSDVMPSKGFGVYVWREPNGTRSYWIYDKNKSEWELYLNESNGQIDIERISDERRYDNRKGMIRFSNFVQFRHWSDSQIDDHDYHWFYVSYNCHIYILALSITQVIDCDVTQSEEHNNRITRRKEGEALGYLGGTAKGWGLQPLELYASSSPRGGVLGYERGTGLWPLVNVSHT